ncbi:hypothetical protein HELRODRAFT_106340 [Helobdella robusta]|uniref:Homeobox domain-containing protein n=1 Tax=Helobdella robusta TaxID=6412 RepID=T1EE22_HELRO|nr:hypothetical protein HELRODRAFT_106340 [Helobdella robusta]ESO01847.1 hypothetical protein HELRODRAFT_106340 [Helobdella robusta]
MESNNCPIMNEGVQIESRCYACGQIIEDHFLMNVFPGVKFHERCLKCVECGKLLDERNVCYCMKAQIYCAHDFNRLFGGRGGNFNENLPGEPHQPQETHSSPSSAPSTSPAAPATRPPRHRTPMTEAQLQALKTSYMSNPRPDARERERLSSVLGLKARVIRVWFQNRRCKEKKENLKN